MCSDEKKNKLFGWVVDPVTGKKRLKRTGSWRLLLRVDLTVLLLLVVVICLALYINTSQADCQAILKDPSLYCPCVNEHGDVISDDFMMIDGLVVEGLNVTGDGFDG